MSSALTGLIGSCFRADEYVGAHAVAGLDGDVISRNDGLQSAQSAKLDFRPNDPKNRALPREIRGGGVQLRFDRDALSVFAEFQGPDLADFYTAILNERILFLQSVGIFKINRDGWSGENDILGDIPGAQERGGNRNEPQKPVQMAFSDFRLRQRGDFSFIMFLLVRRIPEQARIETERRQQRQHDDGGERKNAEPGMHRGDFAQSRPWRRNNFRPTPGKVASSGQSALLMSTWKRAVCRSACWISTVRPRAPP